MDQESTKQKVDMDLYSRQMAVYGAETMGKLVQLKVFIYGIQSIGIEVAKNLILAGPNQVIIHDDEVCTVQDRAVNFYITEAAVKDKLARSVACLPQLKELNSYVNVDLHKGEITTEYLSGFNVVVFHDFYDKAKLCEFDKFCRGKGIGFIVAGSLGLYGYTFVDFGDKFTVFDKNGEQNRSTIVTSITQEEKPVVSVHDEKRHGFEDGDFVMFREVQGMTQINGKTCKITVKSPFTFQIELDTRGFNAYLREGIVEQVKVPTEVQFKSFEQSLQCPIAPERCELDICDYSKMDRPFLEHLIYNALLDFYTHKKQLPRLLNEDDAKELLAIAQKINETNKAASNIAGVLKVDNIDEEITKNIARYARAQTSSIASFWGGIVAQEIVKFTGKYMPIRQWLHYDAFEALPAGQVERKLHNNQYDYMVALFGNQIQETLANSKLFMVGAGALGCELLKLYALTGIGTGKGGLISLTDDDMIENSNLNRQFLFRKKDIKQSKSKCAGNAVKIMNKDLNIKVYQSRVDPENEKTFNDYFWNEQDFVVNAVDNVKARLFIDSKCVWFGKPLFESGTLGTKCNTQTIIPNLSQPYGETSDPAEETFPLCTLKNFPHQIEHTIQWARDYFEQVLVEAPNETIKFLENPKQYIEKVKNQLSSNLPSLKFRLDQIKMMLEAYQKNSYEAFVEIARNHFEDIFHNQIASLLYSFPLDQKTEDGHPFWSGPKRPPKPIKFDSEDPQHIEFVQSCANIMCHCFGLAEIKDVNQIKQMVSKVKVPEFHPKKVTIQDDKNKDNNKQEESLLDTTEENINMLGLELLKLNIKPKSKLKENEFEKDDPTNWHIEFVSAVANLRARNYQIKEVDKFQVKLIAGKIIPALATTTAMVVGCVGLEIIKYAQKKTLAQMRNFFSNLALPLWLFTEPNQPSKVVDKDYDPISLGPIKAIPQGHTSWDKIEVQGPMTVEQFCNFMKEKYNVTLNMITVDKYIIYSVYQKESAEKNFKVDIVKIVETVGQQKVPDYKQYICIQVSAELNGVDAQLPVIKFKVK